MRRWKAAKERVGYDRDPHIYTATAEIERLHRRLWEKRKEALMWKLTVRFKDHLRWASRQSFVEDYDMHSKKADRYCALRVRVSAMEYKP